MKKKIANCIHHTHWDPIWYFTAEDAVVQFNYNMKELLDAFDKGLVKDFFLDGQTAAIDDYLMLHPEDEERIKKLVKSKKLFIGPFNSQLDCFISSGESVINNLRLGFKTGNRLGGVSKIAYLPDSFGHSYDFPKIFNQMDIHDFVITRGVGDEYNLGSEFYQESNDGSKILVCTMISGYGYGAYAFKDNTILTSKAEDYNKLSVHQLIDRLLQYSTIPNEFVFPLGFDQNPAMLNIEEKIEDYNKRSEDYQFHLTTWEDYMKKIREKGVDVKTHQYEIASTQYHRIHKSIFSARADIKTLQDKTERILTFEVQPLMSMLDSLGIPYDQTLIDKAWEMLVQCQTHSSATLTDETNAYIKVKSNSALSLASATKVYLMKIIALSIDIENHYVMPLVVFNTLPYISTLTTKLVVYTKHKNFKLMLDNRELDYVVIESVRQYSGVLRKNTQLMTEDKHFYKTTICLNAGTFEGISYKTIYVIDQDESPKSEVIKSSNHIENERYKLQVDESGITLIDKHVNKTFENVIYLEESGDEGDNYDYSYPIPEDDLIIKDYFKDTTIVHAYNSEFISEMTIRGKVDIPAHLESRKQKLLDNELGYEITFCLKANQPVIEMKGTFNNNSKNHRVRLAFSSEFSNRHSYAGTQYGYIKRETDPKELNIWRKNNWFEEPSPTNPLLNFVSAVSDTYTLTAFTRSVKEYEFIGDGKKDIALTMFRSVGHLGLPDLNRRPGRPSGLDYMVFETPESQLIGDITFEIGFGLYKDFDSNTIMNDYVRYAADNIYYQNQKFEKTVYKLSYFPTNKLSFKIPDQYQFLSISGCEASFGTVVKSLDEKGYILRVFNSENREINGGELNPYFSYTDIQKINLLENKLGKLNQTVGELKRGELVNIKIFK